MVRGQKATKEVVRRKKVMGTTGNLILMYIFMVKLSLMCDVSIIVHRPKKKE